MTIRKSNGHTTVEAGHDLRARTSRKRIEERPMRMLALALVLALQSAPPIQEQVYKKTPQGELKIFIHRPDGWKETDKRPAIVFFFGGGWTSGKVDQFARQAEYLARRGMVAARADY